MSNKYNLFYPDRMLVILLLVFAWFVVLVISFAVIMLLPPVYENYKYLGFPFSLILTLTIYTAFTNPFEIHKIQEMMRNEKNNSQFTISIIYSKFIKRKYVRIIISLIISLIIISILCAIQKLTWVAILISIVILLYCFLLLIRNYVISIRVLNGYFGTNADEAKELINFVLQNSEDIDFTDHDGKLREVFSPETVFSQDESFLPELGEVHS